MRAPSADSSARWRSWIGSILGLAGQVCFWIGGRLMEFGERVDPAAPVLTDERAQRIFDGVMAQIAADQSMLPPFNLMASLPHPTVLRRWTEGH